MVRGWRKALGLIAYTFHTQPSELWGMEIDEIMMWLDLANDIQRQLGKKR